MQGARHQLEDYMKRRGLTQAKLARLANVSQATVSRALRGLPERHGAARHKLFTYARIEPTAAGRSDEQGPERVVEAFGRIWDGSDAHASAVARVIDALDGLRPRSSVRRGKDRDAKRDAPQSTPKKPRPE